MAEKLKIPKWSGLIEADLKKIDLGRRFKPITRQDAESGLLLRGPVVLAAAPQTPEVSRRRLPIIMTNVRLISENNRFFVEYTGSPYRITEFPIQPRIRPTIGGIDIQTETGETVRLRKLLRGDLQMFRFGHGSEETEIEGFLEKFWDEQ
jgi:hypothetical protein